ncbi:MAG: DUF3488 domain-containing protein [Planctomycetes bacterium]|nr:DUF3488 domain-containing protein [Planctomycetota bacterium]
MTADLAFRRSAYALVLTAMATLGAAEVFGPSPTGAPPVVAAFLLVVVAPLATVSAWRRAGGLSRAAVNVLSLACLPVAAADWFFLSGDLLLALAHLLFLVQVARLQQRKSARDWFQLFAVSLMHMVVAVVTSVDLWIAAPLAVYLTLGVATLMLWHFRVEAEMAPPGEGEFIHRAGFLRPRTAGAMAATAVAVLLFTAAFFVVMPRFAGAGLGFLRRDHAALTGFSGRVELGDVVALSRSEAPALWVAPEPGMAQPLYMRGMALPTYRRENGGTGAWVWSGGQEAGGGSPVAAATVTVVNPSEEDGSTFDLPRRRLEADQTHALREMQVLRMPHAATAALFSVGEPARFRFSGVAPRALRMDRAGNLTVSGARVAESSLDYRVTARVPEVPDEVLASRAAVAPPGEGGAGLYLEVPDALRNDRRWRDLARDLAAGARTAHERVTRVKGWLQRSCEYSLAVRPTPGVEPVTDFVFNTRRGYCEYFAAAMVLLLRLEFIPARLATGYAGGEWNSMSERLLFRQSHAHAWVEVPFAGVGWVTFDPTPETSAPVASDIPLLARVADWLAYRWNAYVVQFSAGTQEEMVSAGRRWAASALDRWQATWADLRAGFGGRGGRANTFAGLTRPAAVALAALAAGVVAWAVWRRRVRFFGARAGQAGGKAVAVPFYRALLHLLRREGLQPTEGETAREFAGRAAAPLGPERATAALVLTLAYERVRFGRAVLSPADRAEVERGLGVVGRRSGRERENRFTSR